MIQFVVFPQVSIGPGRVVSVVRGIEGEVASIKH